MRFALLLPQAELYRRELEHISAGLYRAPYDMDPRHRQWSPVYVADKASRLLRASAETVARRAMPDGGRDVLRTATDAAVRDGGEAAVVSESGVNVTYPDYYVQNFHFQTDGWLSTRSARAYEYQTETLFQGSQDASAFWGACVQGMDGQGADALCCVLCSRARSAARGAGAARPLHGRPRGGGHDAARGRSRHGALTRPHTLASHTSSFC